MSRHHINSTLGEAPSKWCQNGSFSGGGLWNDEHFAICRGLPRFRITAACHISALAIRYRRSGIAGISMDRSPPGRAPAMVAGVTARPDPLWKFTLSIAIVGCRQPPADQSRRSHLRRVSWPQAIARLASLRIRSTTVPSFRSKSDCWKRRGQTFDRYRRPEKDPLSRSSNVSAAGQRACFAAKLAQLAHKTPLYPMGPPSLPLRLCSSPSSSERWTFAAAF